MINDAGALNIIIYSSFLCLRSNMAVQGVCIRWRIKTMKRHLSLILSHYCHRSSWLGSFEHWRRFWWKKFWSRLVCLRFWKTFLNRLDLWFFDESFDVQPHLRITQNKPLTLLTNLNFNFNLSFPSLFFFLGFLSNFLFSFFELFVNKALGLFFNNSQKVWWSRFFGIEKLCGVSWEWKIWFYSRTFFDMGVFVVCTIQLKMT